MDSYIQGRQEEWDAEMAAHPGIPLWPIGQTPYLQSDIEQREPSIVPFWAQKGDEPRGAVIICAGGSYLYKEWPEGFGQAKWLNDRGIHAFVLDYRVKPYPCDCALLDAQRAIRLIRHHSDAWGIKRNKIGIMGFSAGGHLAATASTHFDDGKPDAKDGIDQQSCRPDAQIMCYPGITFIPFEGDADLLRFILGDNYTRDDLERTSCDLHVKPDSPPAFLWGAGDDFLAQQWPLYLTALDKNQIPYSYHHFPQGGHGIAGNPDHPINAQWTMLCGNWLKELGF